MKSAFNRSILALAAVLVVAGVSQASAQQKPLKKYESGTKDFWTNPPPDWFLGDETEAQKGQAPPSGPPTGASDAELAAMMKKIKLPEGFSIEVYASNVLEARQMAWGDKGTLFVGSFSLGNVYAIKDVGGKREVKTVLKGLNMPTGVSFRRVEPNEARRARWNVRPFACAKKSMSRGFDPGQPPSMKCTPKASSFSATLSLSVTEKVIPSPWVPSRSVVS